MNVKFIAKCKRELTRNNHKGNWDEWNPDIKALTKELTWHEAKLHSALLSGDLAKIQEYSADVANICEKAFSQAKKADDSREKVYDHYGDFYGWKYPESCGFRPDGAITRR